MNEQRIRLSLSSSCLATLLFAAAPAAAQDAASPPGLRLAPGAKVVNPGARVLFVRPPSGQPRPGYFRTHHLIAVPAGGYPPALRAAGPPFSGWLAETPASLACVYQLGVGNQNSGCDPNVVTTVTSGGSGAIAVVGAGDYGKSTAAADLASYSMQFALPPANLTVVFGTGNPANGCVDGPQPPSALNFTGWDTEMALDTQMAHAIASTARIFLVEANSDSVVDLLNAVDVATACVAAAGGGQVAMSFGTGEFAAQTSLDGHFNTGNNGVVYLASAGDAPGTQWPSTSPYVIGVGGTTINRTGQGFFTSEMVWNVDSVQGSTTGLGTGGGPSSIEPRPSFQDAISPIVGSSRGAPDLAAVADPISGVWIYNTAVCAGWCIIGGTSVGPPLVASIMNLGGLFWSNSPAALSGIYALAAAAGKSASLTTAGNPTFVTSITSGACGSAALGGIYPNAGNPSYDPQYIKAVTGIAWSFCSGWGTLKGLTPSTANPPRLVLQPAASGPQPGGNREHGLTFR